MLDAATIGVIFIGDPRVHIEPGVSMFERMAQVIADSGAGLVYSDSEDHPRIDYQLGSIRDNFDFGPVIVVSVHAAREVWKAGPARWAGLYDLRLRLSEKFPILRIPEPLYASSTTDARPTGEKQFD
jgi:hypothetical protein